MVSSHNIKLTNIKMKNKFSMGTDPEFMLKRNGQIVSAIPVVPRNKYDPEVLNEDTRFYHDNVAIEMTVKPANSPANMVEIMRDIFHNIKSKIPNHSLCTIASHTFTEEECSHEDAMQFGCDPELDVYLRDQVQPPSVEDAKTFRSAGGHIHLGNKTFNSDKPDGFLLSFPDKELAIKLMDIYVGVPFVLLDNDPTSPARKKLYGKAGRFRVTEYGVEYRTLSPYWLTSPRLTNLIAELTFLVMNLGDKGLAKKIINETDMNAVVAAINNNDKNLARKLVDSLDIPENLRKEINDLSNLQIDQEVDKHW